MIAIFDFSLYQATLKRRQYSYLALETRKIYVHLSCGARVFTSKCFIGNDSILIIVS